MKIEQAIQHVAALLVDDEELCKFLDERMRKDYPIFDPTQFEEDSRMEELYYTVRGELLLSIATKALGSLHRLED